MPNAKGLEAAISLAMVAVSHPGASIFFIAQYLSKHDPTFWRLPVGNYIAQHQTFLHVRILLLYYCIANF